MRTRQVSFAARRAQRWAMALLALLAACVAIAALRVSAWPGGLVLAAVLLAPLALPIRGLVRGDRRTYAWASLCVAPCLVYGLTETVANPSARVIAGVMLLASLALFVALVAYLRLTRGDPSAGQEP